MRLINEYFYIGIVHIDEPTVLHALGIDFLNSRPQDCTPLILGYKL